MLNKQIFEAETGKLLVKNPSEKWVGFWRVSLFLLLLFFCFLFFSFLVAFVFVVAVVAVTVV